MAFEAVVTKLVLMRIVVAGCTFAAKSEKRPVEILHLDLQPVFNIDILPVVAVLALLFAVAALQREVGLLAMIEAFPVQRYEIKIRTAMFIMAVRAITLGALTSPGVKSGDRVHPAFDLIVAFQAFQAAPQQTVTRRAVEKPFQLGMRFRQRAGCNLGTRNTAAGQTNKSNQECNTCTPGQFLENLQKPRLPKAVSFTPTVGKHPAHGRKHFPF